MPRDAECSKPSVQRRNYWPDTRTESWSFFQDIPIHSHRNERGTSRTRQGKAQFSPKPPCYPCWDKECQLRGQGQLSCHLCQQLWECRIRIPAGFDPQHGANLTWKDKFKRTHKHNTPIFEGDERVALPPCPGEVAALGARLRKFQQIRQWSPTPSQLAQIRFLGILSGGTPGDLDPIPQAASWEHPERSSDTLLQRVTSSWDVWDFLG